MYCGFKWKGMSKGPKEGGRKLHTVERKRKGKKERGKGKEEDSRPQGGSLSGMLKEEHTKAAGLK